MHAIDLLIFDLDGTLVDSRQDLANAVNYARVMLGQKPLDQVQIMSYVGDGLRNLVIRAFPEAPNEIEHALDLFKFHYADHLLDNTFFYPGVRKVLTQLEVKLMAVISNKSEMFTGAILKGLGSDGLFNLILGGDSVTAMKPNPEPLLFTLRELDVEPARAIMIGDSPSDIQAGKNAGVLTCAVTYGLKSRDILSACDPDLIIDNLEELPDLIH